MVIKIKEISIGRGRKWAWDFGNSVGYTVVATMEGTTTKDTKEEMREAAIAVLSYLEDMEHERCRDIFNIAKFQEDQESLENATKEPAVRKDVLEITESPSVAQQLRDRAGPVAKPKAKYQWFPIAGGGKVRRCEQSPCTSFLKYNEDIKKYQHGKYDPNTKVWSYTHDVCDYWGGGS